MLKYPHTFSKLVGLFLIFFTLAGTGNNIEGRNIHSYTTEWVYSLNDFQDHQAIYYSNYLSFETNEINHHKFQFKTFLSHKNLLIQNTLIVSEELDFPNLSKLATRHLQTNRHSNEPLA